MKAAGKTIARTEPAPLYGPWPLPTLERARALAGGYVAGTQEQRELVAQHIAKTGDCVYHAVSVVFNKPCICQQCRPDIKRYC